MLCTYDPFSTLRNYRGGCWPVKGIGRGGAPCPVVTNFHSIQGIYISGCPIYQASSKVWNAYRIQMPKTRLTTCTLNSDSFSFMFIQKWNLLKTKKKYKCKKTQWKNVPWFEIYSILHCDNSRIFTSRIAVNLNRSWTQTSGITRTFTLSVRFWIIQ